MRFGLCTTNPSHLEYLRRYGYTLFESNFQAVRTMNEDEWGDLCRAVEETGVRMCGMNCFAPYDMRILSWKEAEIDAYFESGVKRAKPLGLEYLVIGSGGARKIPEGMTREEGMARLVAMLRRFGDIAERYDIDVLLEPLRRQETDVVNHIREAVAVCEAVDHPRVGITADFYHIACVGDAFSDIALAGKYLKHIHVATVGRTIPLHNDKAEVLAITDALKSICYNGRVVLEGDAMPDIETALREFSEQFTLFKRPMKIGAQLFTVRDHCQTLEDLEDSLKRIAAIGYQYVQVSGVCEYDPQWLKEKLDEIGLTCVLTHIPIDQLKADAIKVAADHDVLCCRNVGLGYFAFQERTPAEFIEELAPVAATLKEHGKYFMFHNHAFEFIKDPNGVPYLACLAEAFPADQLGFTFDTYWASKAGEDPAAWIRKLSGRLPCIHLKDITDDEKMAVVGEGNVDFDAVFAAAEAAGVQYMLVEQDDCYGEDPFACLARSYTYLKEKGFE